MDFRVVSLNLWGVTPPLERRLEIAALQLARLEPDVVALQEVRPFNDGSGECTAERLAKRLSMESMYRRATSWRAGERGEDGPGEEGLALLVRDPVEACDVLTLPEPRAGDERILLSARLRTPVGPVWAHTTHLHWRLDDGLARERQVVAIDRRIRELDCGMPQVLCGDFNAIPESDEIRYLRGLCSLEGDRTYYQDAWAHCHSGSGGATHSTDNPNNQPPRSFDCSRRIDYVFVTPRQRGGCGSIRESAIVLSEADGGVCASDHYGVYAVIDLGAPLIAGAPAGGATPG